jgi:exodeoxyribonuclease V beta subunit
MAKSGTRLLAPAARRAIAVDLANHVVTLLDSAEIRRGAAFAPVRPGDIAVLLRGHAEAEFVVRELAERGITAVRSKLGTVVETPAMAQLRVLAAAIADPANARLARALVLTWFVDLPHSAVLDEGVVERLQARCAGWGNVLERGGAAALLGELRTDNEVLGALAREDLERRLTDIEHILELVQAETKGAGIHRSHLVRVLDALAADTADSDSRARRTDTDADAVQITSMHSSKGLEYPIVLVPYPKELKTDTPHVFSVRDESSARLRRVDAAPWSDWTEGDITPALRLGSTTAEIHDDERRLIYVALTRAKHQVIVWWAGTQGVEKGSLAQVLFRDATGERIVVPGDDNGLDGYFTELVGRIGPSCAVRRLGIDVEPIERPAASANSAPLLTNAEWTRGELRRAEWYRWSFSSLMASDLAPTHDRLRGGNDEGDAGGDADDSDAPALDSVFHAPLLGLPAHAEFGTLVHELMERSDFTRPDRAEHLLELIRSDGRVEALEIDPVALRDGLDALIATPLHGLFDNTRLADIPAVDRLAEMDFHFPILDTHGSLLRTEIARIAALDTASPYHDYFTRLSAGWTTERIGGLMTGSIDAVLRVGSRYAVVDYKSNRLHTPGDTATNGNYSGAALLRAMESHDYPMQALLYSVALHRFLSMRLPGYDPDVHHAGSGYLFVRGMTGADTPVINGQVRGLSAWRPSTAVLRRLDALFAGKELVA